MLRFLSLSAITLFVFMLGCGNYSKECWEDVCKITENGVVSYEGNQEKIAKLIEQDKARVAAIQARELRYQNMPRRKAGETIRVGVMKPESNYDDLNQYRNTFYQWIINTLRQDRQLEIIPHEKMRSYLSMVKTEVPVTRGWNQSGPRSKRVVVPNEKTLKQLRDLGLKIDVLLYSSLSPKKQSGLVGGKGQGVGVISASRIEISGLASSIFDFRAFRHSQVGKSASQIDIAGRDKDGEIKSASIKNNKRNIKLDRPAAEAFARHYAQVIRIQIGPHLPDLQALNQ